MGGEQRELQRALLGLPAPIPAEMRHNPTQGAAVLEVLR